MSRNNHYTEGRRWSYISNAWIFEEGWNDQEEIAMLRAHLEAAKTQAAPVCNGGVCVGCGTRWIGKYKGCKCFIPATVSPSPVCNGVTEEPVEYTLDDFKYGRVRIDFRESTIREIHQLRAICKAIEPNRREPAYTFGNAYYCNQERWFEGATHNLIGNQFDVCRVAQIKITSPERGIVADDPQCRAELETVREALKDCLVLADSASKTEEQWNEIASAPSASAYKRLLRVREALAILDKMMGE